MCSVVGYIGTENCRDFVLQGLERLEYRGYDSSGFACLSRSDNRLRYAKSAGRLQNLVNQLQQSPIDGCIGMGHTRWSTHGHSSQENAHPQFDCHKKIAIVHNGIIENHHELRRELEQSGHVFHSNTDTEVVAHLLESLLSVHGNLRTIMTELVNRVEGAYSFIIILEEFPDRMIIVRRRSPLCVGIGDGHMFVASDPIAFAGKTSKVLFMPDETFAIVQKDIIELYDFMGKLLPVTIDHVALSWVDQEKKGHEHFMLKEIYEQKGAILNTINSLQALDATLWDNIGLTPEQVQSLERVHIIGCGTSWHAARIGQFFFEQVCQIPTQVHLASEFRYMPFFAQENTFYLFISQSGETADTLEALRLVNSMVLPTVALTNVASSTLVREAGGFLLTQAGHEIAVASTKAFSTQIAALYWLVHRIAYQKGMVTKQQLRIADEELLVVAEMLENSIENYKLPIITTLAKRYAQMRKCIFLGRHISYPFALEAALKLKEISYIFSQCYPAGELKHGPLALIDHDIPVFLFSHQDSVIYQKLLSNAQEVKARKGHLVVFAFEGQKELIELADYAFIVPRVNPLLGPLSMTGLMQFFVYTIAKELDRPIDKPRNLAKSVTVE